MLIDDCIFCKIIKGEIPSTKLYEDDDMIIIKDINPKAKIHLLAIVKNHYARLQEIKDFEAEQLGKCLFKIGCMREMLGLKEGYRVIINQGENGRQEVQHLHIHLLGGEKLSEF